MRTICETKFIGAQMLIEKKLVRSEVKKRKENTLCRHGENPINQQCEKPNLEQREILIRFRLWESEQFLIGFEMRGQLNYGPVFALCCSVASFFL